MTTPRSSFRHVPSPAGPSAPAGPPIPPQQNSSQVEPTTVPAPAFSAHRVAEEGSPLPVSRARVRVQRLLCGVAALSVLALIPGTRTFATVMLVLLIPVAGSEWFRTRRLTDGTPARAALAAAAAFVMAIIGIAISPTPQGPTATSPAASAPAAQPAAPLAPAQPITAHEWQKIAKDPAGHNGQRIVIYGEVTQFDASTGTGSFRANVDGIPHDSQSGFITYPTNTMLDGDPSTLSDLVQGDTFKAEATVAGADTYTNTMGGSMTAPELTVTRITTTGVVN